MLSKIIGEEEEKQKAHKFLQTLQFQKNSLQKKKNRKAAKRAKTNLPQQNSEIDDDGDDDEDSDPSCLAITYIIFYAEGQRRMNL